MKTSSSRPSQVSPLVAAAAIALAVLLIAGVYWKYWMAPSRRTPNSKAELQTQTMKREMMRSLKERLNAPKTSEETGQGKDKAAAASKPK